MSNHTFILNGTQVTVDCEDTLRMLWVIRDLLGVHGPKYGCGLGVCQACTSHLNGEAVNLCSIPISDVKPTDEIVTIEGLPATVGQPLHPMQQAWLDYDVPQCGYCQPGQIMAAVALVQEVQAEGRKVDENDLDNIRNVCRCGTYYRIREAIEVGAANMSKNAVGVCTSAREFEIRLGPKDEILKDPAVKVDGRRVHVNEKKGQRPTAMIDLRGDDRETVRVTITGRTRAGAFHDVRTYHPCPVKSVHKPHVLPKQHRAKKHTHATSKART